MKVPLVAVWKQVVRETCCSGRAVGVEVSTAVVLNLGSIGPQGLWVRRRGILSNKSKRNKIHDTYFVFPNNKGSINACMEIVGFSTSNKVKNHCSRDSAGKGV